MTASITAVSPISPRKEAGKPATKAARQTFDHAQKFIGYRASLDRKLAEVKSRMGNRLLTHPSYKPDPRHSLREEIWMNAKAPWWEYAAKAAREARQANPEYRRAQAQIQSQIRNYQGAQA